MKYFIRHTVNRPGTGVRDKGQTVQPGQQPQWKSSDASHSARKPNNGVQKTVASNTRAAGFRVAAGPDHKQLQPAFHNTGIL